MGIAVSSNIFCTFRSLHLAGNQSPKMAKKADENLKDKIKSLFRLNKDKGSPVQYQRASLKDFVFTADILKVDMGLLNERE